MKRLLITGMACLAAALLLVGTAPLAAGQYRRHETYRNPFDSFPLWKDVPGKTFAVLGEGKLKNGSRWAVYASRGGPGRVAAENPCVSVARITRHGQYGAAHRCGPLAPSGNGEPPVDISITGSYQEPGKPVIGESVIGLSVQTNILKIKATTSEGKVIERRTKLLNSSQQRKIHLPPMRYVALGLQHDVCLETIRGLDDEGQVVFDEPTLEC